MASSLFKFLPKKKFKRRLMTYSNTFKILFFFFLGLIFNSCKNTAIFELIPQPEVSIQTDKYQEIKNNDSYFELKKGQKYFIKITTPGNFNGYLVIKTKKENLNSYLRDSFVVSEKINIIDEIAKRSDMFAYKIKADKKYYFIIEEVFSDGPFEAAYRFMNDSLYFVENFEFYKSSLEKARLDKSLVEKKILEDSLINVNLENQIKAISGKITVLENIINELSNLDLCQDSDNKEKKDNSICDSYFAILNEYKNELEYQKEYKLILESYDAINVSRNNYNMFLSKAPLVLNYFEAVGYYKNSRSKKMSEILKNRFFENKDYLSELLINESFKEKFKDVRKLFYICIDDIETFDDVKGGENRVFQKVILSKGMSKSRDMQIAIDKAILEARTKLARYLVEQKIIENAGDANQIKAKLENSKVIFQVFKKNKDVYEAIAIVSYVL